MCRGEREEGGSKEKEGNFVVNERSVLAYPKKKFWPHGNHQPLQHAKQKRRDATRSQKSYQLLIWLTDDNASSNNKIMETRLCRYPPLFFFPSFLPSFPHLLRNLSSFSCRLYAFPEEREREREREKESGNRSLEKGKRRDVQLILLLLLGKKRGEDGCARKEDEEVFLKLCVVCFGVGWSWEIGEMIQKTYKKRKKRVGSRRTETTI